jgi:NSS family neurotransmitter:Na+ symporter
MSQHTTQEEWGTRLGVILAVAGSAVGLGNFLRFPGQAAQNGGGAFMIPYICALLLLGIPIGWAEWTMGRYGGRKGLHSAPAVMGLFGGRIGRYLGVIGVLIPLAVSFYYTFIEAWCLGYFWQYLTGGIGIDVAAPITEQSAAAAAHYAGFTGLAADGALFQGLQPAVVFWAITIAVNIFFVYRGLSRGIEKFCQYAMPAMAVCALIVLIRVLTLGTPDPINAPDQNVLNGLGYMWNPQFDALWNPQTWLAAAGQIFFSLSVGFGVIINYASYMKKKDDVVLSGLTASATNELFEVGFGGMITLTASFIFLGLSATTAAVAGGTFGLGFTTLPVVFAHMGSFGNVIGAVWFLMLFLAAITSSLSMYQPVLAFLHESLGISRAKATGALVGVVMVGSTMTIYFTKDGTFLGTIDNWVGTLLIFLLAMVQIICFSWIFGIRRGWEEAHLGAQIRIPGFYRFIMKFVAPLYLLIVFGAFCVGNLPSWVAAVGASTAQQLAIGLILAVTAGLCVCVAIGEKRWRAMGLDIDNKIPLND